MIFECVASILFKVKVVAIVTVSGTVVVLPVLIARLKGTNKDSLLYKLCVLTTANEELHFTHCQLNITTILEHQYFLCFEVDCDVNTPATCCLSTWSYFKNIYMWIGCSWYMPDIKVIWYNIESQSGKALDTIIVVVQCDVSQGDSCGEYEQ